MAGTYVDIDPIQGRAPLVEGATTLHDVTETVARQVCGLRFGLALWASHPGPGELA